VPDKLSAALAPSIDETKREKLLSLKHNIYEHLQELKVYEVTKLPSSVNSTKAKRRTELGSPHMRQSTTLPQRNTNQLHAKLNSQTKNQN
jgi:hypothetical protein